MEYKIEKKKLSASKFPFGKLKAGESFLEPDPHGANNLRVQATFFSQSKGGKVKFSIRKESDGYRCYRIK